MTATDNVSAADTPRRVAALSRELYVRGPAVAVAMQHYRPYISPFERLLGMVPAGSEVLDIGCGSGLFLGLLGKTGRIRGGLGIDSSAPAIALAQAMTAQLPPGHGLRFEARDASAPLPDARFDVVSLIDVMHHIPPPHQRQVLEQALERVKPGGLLIYKDMVARPLWRAAMNRLHDLVVARQWINYLPLDHAIDWARARDFVVERSQAVDMLWYGHEIVTFRAPQRAAPERAT